MRDIFELKGKIAKLLKENKAVWYKHCPFPVIARGERYTEEDYQVWLLMRSTTLVPNNNRIVSLLEDYRHLFKEQDQETISMYLLHAEGYKKWVNAEVEYNSIVRFPVAFEELILG